jgi:hypothetical protein
VTPQTIALITYFFLALILLLFAFAVLWAIWSGRISLDGLLTELPAAGGKVEDAKASLSRFQFLIFTFVVAGLFLMLSIEGGDFAKIPDNVLALIGISGGTYVVSKGVTKSGNGKGRRP